MKQSTTLLTCILIFISVSAFGQTVSYRVLSKDINTYRGSVQLRIPMTLNSYNALGLNVGAQAEYRLPVIPLTIRGNFEVEIGGLGEGEALGGEGGRFREIDAGVMYPLLSGRTKTGRVKVVLDAGSNSAMRWEEYIYADGQIKNQLMARGGLLHWGARQFRASGLSAGIAFRKLEHTQVEFDKWPDYTYTTYRQVLIYADALLLPVTSATTDDFTADTEPTTIGFRLGFLVEWQARNSLYLEIGARPAPNNFAVGFINFGYTFGFGLK